MWIFNLFLIYFLIIFFSFQTLAREKLGTLTVDDLLLRPMFTLNEGPRGEFTVHQSSVNFLWEKDENFRASLKVGSLILRNPMLHFSDQVSRELGMVEAYAVISGMLGKVSMGLMPVEYGIEGSWQEGELIFERNFLYQYRVLPLRDFGLKYKIDFKGFYTQIMVQNGEGESENLDGRMFVSSKWGWTNNRNVDVGVSGLTGTVKPAIGQVLPTTFLAAIDYSKESLWRTGTVFLYWHPNQWHFLLETTFGESEQNEIVTKFNGGHMDLGFNWGEQFSTYLRYDHFDPNDAVYGDLLRKTSVAIATSDKYKTNTWILSFGKVFEQQNSINNDELYLVWRVTPLTP